uniref:Scm like with four mbt domains 2 n=1 Tax=Coturnix japonica TaxID=93934 RepID=A0A8C2SWQ8_COTJA
MDTRASFITTVQESQHLSPEKGQGLANGDGEQFDSDEGSSIEDADFNWDEYLEETGASAAPHTSFKHVEISLQSSFQPGMKLEVANKSNPDTYWVATIITTCGQLLLLRYCGYGDDRRADFWCDVMTADLHPVGWCTQNNKVLMPPDGRCFLKPLALEPERCESIHQLNHAGFKMSWTQPKGSRHISVHKLLFQRGL